MEKRSIELIVAALVIISILFIYFLYYASFINLMSRVGLAFLMLIAVGITIQRLMGLSGGYGFYMLGSKKGLSTIAHIAQRHKVFWDVMAVWGLTLGFGLLTYPLLKGKMDKRVYGFGILSLVLIMFFVLPYVGSAFQFINIPQIQNAIASSQSSQSTGTQLLTYATTAVTIIAGFTGSIFASIFINAESILYSLIQYFTLGAAASGIHNQIPGVAPIIPGIDIPLIAGIASLAILLIIHEFSHGVLAKIAKVRLKSIGLLAFGFIPIGGYVEPDEKQVSKLDKMKQTKIFSAGIAANFIAMLFFFVLVLLFMTYVLPNTIHYKVVVSGTEPNYPASNVLKSGMQVLKWNNNSITDMASLTAAASQDTPNGIVTILTDNGTYSFKAVASPTNSSRGIIGVSLGYMPSIKTPIEKTVYFLYTLFSLSLLLNFLVAVVNLLPIPGFDGYRIYTANIKKTLYVNVLGAFIILLIAVNVLPWLFSYL